MGQGSRLAAGRAPRPCTVRLLWTTLWASCVLAHLGAQRLGDGLPQTSAEGAFSILIQGLARMYLSDCRTAAGLPCIGAAVGIPARAVAG
jgi:hypothetical protein